MKAAAAGLLHGIDPVAYASLEGVEAMWATEVLQRAEDLWHERQQSLIKAIEVAVQNGVVRAFRGR